MRSVSLVDTGLFCECSTTILCDPSIHAVTDAEPSDVAANRNNFAREFVAQHKRKLWPHDCTKLSFSELEIDRVQTRSAYFDENVAWPGPRCRDIHQAGAFGVNVALKNICTHNPLPLQRVSQRPRA